MNQTRHQRPTDLHDRAMLAADYGDRANRRQRPGDARLFFSVALRLERAALAEFSRRRLEPSTMIIAKSARALADILRGTPENLVR